MQNRKLYRTSYEFLYSFDIVSGLGFIFVFYENCFFSFFLRHFLRKKVLSKVLFGNEVDWRQQKYGKGMSKNDVTLTWDWHSFELRLLKLNQNCDFQNFEFRKKVQALKNSILVYFRNMSQRWRHYNDRPLFFFKDLSGAKRSIEIAVPGRLFNLGSEIWLGST